VQLAIRYRQKLYTLYASVFAAIENLRASWLYAVWRPTADELLCSLHLHWGDKVLLAVLLTVCLFPAYDLGVLEIGKPRKLQI